MMQSLGQAVSLTSVGLIVVYVVLGILALVVAYRLDTMRHERGKSLLRLAMDRIRYGPDLQRSGRVLPLFLTLVVVGLAAVALLWANTGPASTDAGEDGPSEARTTTAVASADPAASAVEAAVAVSREAYPDGAENVVVTRSGASVDALAAGALQGQLAGPLLLTGFEELAPETAAEIERLGTPAVHVVGGVDAVSTEVEAELRALGNALYRYGGPTGLETAVDVAARHFPDATSAVLAPAYAAGEAQEETLARAVAAGALAAAQQRPILLTDADELSPATAAYLAESSITQVTVVGNLEDLSSDVVEEMGLNGIDVTRVEAEDRFTMSVAIAEAGGFSGQELILVQGSGPTLWPSGFVAAAYAGQLDAPVLLADGETLPAPVGTYIEGRAGTVTSVRCLTGVSEAACSAAREAAGVPAGPGPSPGAGPAPGAGSTPTTAP